LTVQVELVQVRPEQFDDEAVALGEAVRRLEKM